GVEASQAEGKRREAGQFGLAHFVDRPTAQPDAEREERPLLKKDKEDFTHGAAPGKCDTVAPHADSPGRVKKSATRKRKSGRTSSPVTSSVSSKACCSCPGR